MSEDDNSKIMILALILGGAYFLTKDKEKKKDTIPLVEYGPERGTNPPAGVDIGDVPSMPPEPFIDNFIKIQIAVVAGFVTFKFRNQIIAVPLASIIKLKTLLYYYRNILGGTLTIENLNNIYAIVIGRNIDRAIEILPDLYNFFINEFLDITSFRVSNIMRKYRRLRSPEEGGLTSFENNPRANIRELENSLSGDVEMGGSGNISPNQSDIDESMIKQNGIIKKWEDVISKAKEKAKQVFAFIGNKTNVLIQTEPVKKLQTFIQNRKIQLSELNYYLRTIEKNPEEFKLVREEIGEIENEIRDAFSKIESFQEVQPETIEIISKNKGKTGSFTIELKQPTINIEIEKKENQPLVGFGQSIQISEETEKEEVSEEKEEKQEESASIGGLFGSTEEDVEEKKKSTEEAIDDIVRTTAVLRYNVLSDTFTQEGPRYNENTTDIVVNENTYNITDIMQEYFKLVSILKFNAMTLEQIKEIYGDDSPQYDLFFYFKDNLPDIEKALLDKNFIKKRNFNYLMQFHFYKLHRLLSKFPVESFTRKDYVEESKKAIEDLYKLINQFESVKPRQF